MIDIKELSEQELKQKIENIKAEREKTADALKRYEEELERRKQEVPLGVPLKDKTKAHHFGVYELGFQSEESMHVFHEWFKTEVDSLISNAKGDPIDIQVLLPLLVKGYVFYDPANNYWIYCINKPIKTSNGWLISGGFNLISGFNLKPAEDWRNSLMECGL